MYIFYCNKIMYLVRCCHLVYEMRSRGQEETHPYEKHDEQTLAVYFPSKCFKVNVVL